MEEPKRVFCEDCRCWEDVPGVDGRCHRKAPIAKNSKGEVFPATNYDDYCFDGIKKSEDELEKSVR
ncbi:MAG TPA: hypothetical protein PKC79_20420 [Solidesulfovibrio magneticus]|nr:hypothetical protein [Solidesulfovibrio magneticus]